MYCYKPTEKTEWNTNNTKKGIKRKRGQRQNQQQDINGFDNPIKKQRQKDWV